MFTDNLPEGSHELLDGYKHDIIATEQHIDFITNRSFRCTLLCHDHVALNHAFTPEITQKFHFSGLARQAFVTQPVAPGSVAFQTDEGAVLQSKDPFIISLFSLLEEALPGRLSFS